MEARTAFDRLLSEGEAVSAAPVLPSETDEQRIIRQNREAIKSWAAAGVPIKVAT